MPSKQNIIKAFEEIAKKAKSTDILVVYLAGHGINWGGQDGDFYFLTQDAYTANPDAYNDPAIRQNSTLSSEELVNLIKQVPALKQVLIIDACASGRIVDDLVAKRDALSSTTIRALDRMKDNLNLSAYTDDQLYELSARGGEAPLVFLDVKQFPDACKLSGTYSKADNQLKLSYKIKCGKKDLKNEITSASEVELKKKLIEQVNEAVKGL